MVKFERKGGEDRSVGYCRRGRTVTSVSLEDTETRIQVQSQDRQRPRKEPQDYGRERLCAR